MRHISFGYFGRETIAAALGIPPRTISSWYRANGSKGPFLTKTAREYERALAVLLLERFPECIEQIAGTHRSTPRMIRHWAMQVRNPEYSSELMAATRLTMVIINPQIKDLFASEGGKLILRQGRYPDDSRARELIFQIYDHILGQILDSAHFLQVMRQMRDRRYRYYAHKGLNSDSEYAFYDRIPLLLRLNGPHRYRGASIENGFVELSDHVDYQRKEYKGIMRNIGDIYLKSNYRIAQGLFQETYDSSPYAVTKRKFHIEFGKSWTYWNEKDMFLQYFTTVHPNFAPIRERIPRRTLRQ